MKNFPEKALRSDFLLHQTEEGRTRIEIRIQDETVYMTQVADPFFFVPRIGPVIPF